MRLRKVLRILFKSILILTGISVLIFFVLFAPLNRDHYKDSAYYKKTLNAVDSISESNSSKGPLKAGWAKANITPDFPLPIASYGIRNNFEKVHDSIWCRAFVFDNGIEKSAIVTLDLLIFPPVLVEKLKNKLPEIGFSLGNTYLSTSHTHNSVGGWAEGIGGRFLAGEYNEQYVNFLLESVLASIKNASGNMHHASIGFAKYEAEKFVFNRLSDDKNDVDHWLRVIKIQKTSGETAAIVTYAAHPNVLSMKMDEISGDYAGALVDSLEKSKVIHFAAFCAGAVGAHRCRIEDKKNYAFIGIISSYLSKKIVENFQSIQLEDSIKIRSINVPVYLRDPQLRIAAEWKLRPWAFDYLFGKQEVYLSAMQLNDIVLIGTPCDFSGELVKEFSDVSHRKQINVVVTGFNGGYIGYIIPDEHYGQVERREAKEMNWYGPYSGSYFTEIINAILRKI